MILPWIPKMALLCAASAAVPAREPEAPEFPRLEGLLAPGPAGVSLASLSVELAGAGQEGHALGEEAGGDHAAFESSDRFRFTTIRAWGYRDFLPGDDHTDVLGFEFNSSWGWGAFDVTNISYFELAEYPRAIPGQPAGNPGGSGGLEGADGITDILSAFLFSKQGDHSGPHHFALGAAGQFPTASDDILGSGKWSFGPAAEYEYHKDRFFAAFVALQLWSVAGDDDRKEVNMLMVKPMVTYDLDERWKLVYMPYGISQYWNKPSGQQLYVPLGGGVQYGFDVRGLQMATSLQFFNYAVRPDDGSENEIRFMLEFNL